MKHVNAKQDLSDVKALLSAMAVEVKELEKTYSQVLEVVKKVEQTTNRDDLTGLLRRTAFFTRWNALLTECQSIGENCGVIMIDIDHFKSINDQYGHATGDQVIKRVAELLRKYESDECLVARLGGEEFVVALKGTDAEMLGTAEFIRREAERLHGPVENTNVEWRCTVSLGCSSTKSQGYESKKLLDSSDQALYSAKKGGRNKVAAA